MLVKIITVAMAFGLSVLVLLPVSADARGGHGRRHCGMHKHLDYGTMSCVKNKG